MRVIAVDNYDAVDVGAEGTVAQSNTRSPWIKFDAPTRFSPAVTSAEIPIPAGFADCLNEDQLELIELVRTIEDDLRDFGNAFEIDGKRVDPSRVRVYRTSWPNRHD